MLQGGKCSKSRLGPIIGL